MLSIGSVQILSPINGVNVESDDISENVGACVEESSDARVRFERKTLPGERISIRFTGIHPVNDGFLSVERYDF
jgi:hypothetical protein